ncbi:uncharacterized protein AKAME5_001015100 [Lates japonicus]|uniref:Uncharacterized protein n=1 Tax=Lates japonicus TaxID=270547 RepID=A0AAD3R7Q1_LATJO|nr:uncharacterized protein AKAME5_001015100 [Lates japonicus]
MPQKRRTARQVAGRNQNHWMESHALQQEMCHLRDLLSTERANCCREYNWRIQLSHELEETKQQLVNQKHLKEVFINREKETKRELERLRNYSDAETLSTTKIATQVRNNINAVCQEKFNSELQVEKEKVKVLQEDLKLSYDKFMAELQMEKDKNNVLQEELKLCQSKLTAELQVEKEKNNHLHKELKVGQERFDTELQMEKVKKKALQEELEKLRTSYQEVSERYEVDVLTARQQADSLLRELENQIKSHKDKVLQDELLINLRDDRDTLLQQMVQENNHVIELVQKDTAEKDLMLSSHATLSSPQSPL